MFGPVVRSSVSGDQRGPNESKFEVSVLAEKFTVLSSVPKSFRLFWMHTRANSRRRNPPTLFDRGSCLLCKLCIPLPMVVALFMRPTPTVFE